MLAVKPLKSNISGNAFRRSPPFPAGGLNGLRRKISFLASGSRVNRSVQIQAVISGGDKAATSPLDSKESNGSVLASSSSSSGSEGIEGRAVVTIRKKMKEKITEKFEDQWEYFINGVGQGIQIQLISEEIDPVTNSGKSVQSWVRGWLPKASNLSYIVEYAANFTVPNDFGCPGAILITNLHGKEFYLLEIVFHGFDGGPIFFPANTWIHSRNDNPESRIIFKNQVVRTVKSVDSLL